MGLEAMKALSQCYACLSHTSGLDPSHLKEQSILFAVHLKQLRYQSPEIFCVRPKLHQWLELCSSGIIPVMSGIIEKKIWVAAWPAWP